MCMTFRRLVVAAILAATPVAAQAAAPVPAATGKAKAENPMAAARKALDEVGDMNYQGRSLTDVLNDIKDKAKVPVVLDNMVYQFGLDPSQPIVTVNLKQVKLRDGLKAALAPFNLKYGLTAEGVYVSTEEGVISKQLRQRVSVDCDGTPFAAAVKQLALDTGANVVVDPRLADKANKAVTLKLEEVPLETAVRLLAEVADLRAIRSSNVLFVTSPDKAKEKGLHDDGPTTPGQVSPFFPGGGPPIPGVIGGFGGIAFPGGINPPPAVDPAVPLPPDLPVQAPAVPPATGTTTPAPAPGPTPAAPPAKPDVPPAKPDVPPAKPDVPPAKPDVPPAPPVEKRP